MKMEKIKLGFASDHRGYELKQELLSLRFQHATGQLENGKKITELRKTIARIYTVIKERELGIN